MLQITGLTKYFGGQRIFEDGSLMLNRGERLGLVGRNGSGKSTLFKLILDEEHPDSGTISYPKGYRIGRLSQHLEFTESTILAEACLGLPEEERDLTYKGEIILGGLGFSETDLARNPNEFSGGFQIRVNLAKLLLSEPDLLLLDEPTNYLDILSSRWLANTLKEWKSEMILITHDRSFMNQVTTHTALIYRGAFRKIPGSTEKLYETIAVAEEVYEKTRINDDKKRKELEQFINRFRATASKAALVQSRVKALERMEVKESVVQEESLDFEFRSVPFHGKTLLEAKEISFGYDANKLLIDRLTIAVGKNDRIGIIGKNGQGKSTLLRMLAKDLTPLSGDISYSQATQLAYFGQTNIQRLNDQRTVEEEIGSVDSGLSRTKVRNICGTVMFNGDKALKKISVLSGGEKSRVLLGKILVTPSNVLLLDEPTNHLDLESVEALRTALEKIDGAMVLVTHDEMMLRSLCTRLVVFQGKKPFIFEGTYDYFLEKIGWEDEGGVLPSSRQSDKSDKDSSSTDKIDPRIHKANTKKIQKIESDIVKLEEKQKKLEAQLDVAVDTQDMKRIEEASMELSEVLEKINVAFEELSDLE